MKPALCRQSRSGVFTITPTTHLEGPPSLPRSLTLSNETNFSSSLELPRFNGHGKCDYKLVELSSLQPCTEATLWARSTSQAATRSVEAPTLCSAEHQIAVRHLVSKQQSPCRGAGGRGDTFAPRELRACQPL